MVTMESASQDVGGERKETGQADQAAGQTGDSRTPQGNGVAAAL